MTETSEGSKVYQIKFESLDAYENYQFKFAANGSWADNWGLPEQGIRQQVLVIGDRLAKLAGDA